MFWERKREKEREERKRDGVERESFFCFPSERASSNATSAWHRSAARVWKRDRNWRDFESVFLSPPHLHRLFQPLFLLSAASRSLPVRPKGVANASDFAKAEREAGH